MNHNGNRNDYLFSIKEKIEVTFKYPLKIDILADQAGCSKSKLQHDFQKRFGVSIQDYQSMVRNAIAKKLLAQPEDSIKWIAKSVGYKNPESFTRAFKKINGMCPKEYRSQLRRE